MDLFAGGLASLLVVASYMTSNMWMADGGSAMLAGGVNVAAWIAQFYGHGVHEGRAPALLDNLFQVRTVPFRVGTAVGVHVVILLFFVCQSVALFVYISFSYTRRFVVFSLC